MNTLRIMRTNQDYSVRHLQTDLPAVLSNLESCGWHLLLIMSSQFLPRAGLRGHTGLPLQWCLRVPSADRENCIKGWSQGFLWVRTRIVSSCGRQFPSCGLMHIPLACRRGVGAEGWASNEKKKLMRKKPSFSWRTKGNLNLGPTYF